MVYVSSRSSRWYALSLLVPILVLSQSILTTAQKHCQDPIVRKEWRTLSKSARLNYLDAVHCLLSTPPLTPLSAAPGIRSRYDDFVATHINQTLSIHFVGHFLPWHRWFTAVYETALREECSYEGAQPYWDWTLDTPADEFMESPVFDDRYGFGGNGALVPIDESDPNEVLGRTGGGCIEGGPFKDLVVRLGPLNGLGDNPRCLTRDLAPYYAARFLGRNQTELTLRQKDFGWFDRVLQGGQTFDASGIHDGGHYGVGGTYGVMADPFASPADPIFWMHHANVDRLWWSWQKQDLWERLWDISGPIFMQDYGNEKGGNTTLDYKLSLWSNAKDIVVSDVMDIQGGGLCYDYDELYESDRDMENSEDESQEMGFDW
ncbi:Di-copper centre-containing protein [Amniculicola lignicola CBS 123094]|uniref:Di-copper centre-containing protein n=1 Tax=Amniculicola lignicola CBS 123094 TaxID=1392246 RepID=A0A6A5WD58_9PLEO|nr:Di-copper centre-containing protein [Amniculicola lignicola CBS 123094]